jgi:hypothetical protein
MTPSITIDASAFGANIRELIRVTGLDSGEIIRSQAALFVKKVVQFTPPKTLAQGRKAIARDIDNAVTVFDPAKARSDRMRQVIEAQDYEAMKSILDASNKGKAWRVEKFTPTLHTSQRDRRGRVKSSKRVVSPDLRQVKQYIAEVQKRSGYARSGWVPAMQALGMPVPAWMQRHSSQRAGGVVDETRTANPSITMTHSASKIPNYGRVVDSALKSRTASLNTLIKRVLERQNVNLGFRTFGPTS